LQLALADQRKRKMKAAQEITLNPEDFLKMAAALSV